MAGSRKDNRPANLAAKLCAVYAGGELRCETGSLGTGYDDNNEEEFDAAGGVVADGSANITGSVDVNWYLSSAGVAGSTTDLPTYTAAPVTGTFTAAAGAPFTGTVTGVDLLTCPIFNPTVDGAACNQDTFAYYLIDATGENIAIETDSNQLSLGYFDQQ